MNQPPRDTADPRVRTLARVLLAAILLAVIAGFVWIARGPSEATRIAGAFNGGGTPAGRAVETCRRAVADDPAAPAHRSVLMFGVMETAGGALLVEGELPGDGAPAMRLACEVVDGRVQNLGYRPARVGGLEPRP